MSTTGLFYVEGVEVMGPPPDGWIPNIVDPVRNWDLASYIVIGVGNLLVFMFMYQRFYVKLVINKKFEIEDACLIVAWAFSTAVQIQILHAFVNKYLGVHFWELPVTQFAVFEYQAAYLFSIVYIPSQMCAKLVLALFYRRLSPQVWFNYFVWATTFAIVGSYIGILFASIFTCTPVKKAWVPTMEGTCLDVGALYKATAIIGVILDLILILLPLPVVARLQIPTRQKVGLFFIFSVGSATVVTSFKRYFVLVEQMTQTSDFVWYAAESSGWVLIETNLSIMCACVPTLRGFFRAVAPYLIGIRSSDRNNSSKSKGKSTHPSRRTDPSGSSRGQDPTLATIGGTGGSRNRNYQRFGDDEEAGYGLDTIVQRDDDGGRRDTDDDSEKGIIQTQSVTVTFSRPEGDGASR